MLLGIFAFTRFEQRPVTTKTFPTPEERLPITGCYFARISNDLYILNIESEEEGRVKGTLAFNNFEKDSSSGTFDGTYKDGILLGDYAFRSEGMDSVMEVIFKKSGEDFIRGVGPVDETGTKFANLDEITYNPGSPLFLFKKGVCTQ